MSDKKSDLLGKINKNTKEIIDNVFCGKLTLDEYSFLKELDFKELKSFCFSGRDNDNEVHIGMVDGRYFFYHVNNCDVWYDGFGFLDEISLI